MKKMTKAERVKIATEVRKMLTPVKTASSTFDMEKLNIAIELMNKVLSEPGKIND